MKKIFIIIIACGFISGSLHAQSGADSLLNFLLKNKERTSVYLQKNDYVIARLNEDKQMPLAATMNIMVAVEFAKQSVYNVINYNNYVALKDIEKFYFQNTDDNAYNNWIKYETRVDHIKSDSIKLIDVARGMIVYGSNANAEFLMQMLGFGNVQNDVRMFGLKAHSKLFPLPAALLLYQNPQNLTEDKSEKSIEAMSDSDYYNSVFEAHRQLNIDSANKQNFPPQGLSVKLQKAWSDRLPSSTTKDYARVARIINNHLILDEKTYAVLSRILETYMETPSTRLWLQHAGFIKGTTISVFTNVAYATLRDGIPGGHGTKIELIYFFNNLTQKENRKLQSWSNDFETKVLRDEKFRKKLIDGIAGKKK